MRAMGPGSVSSLLKTALDVVYLLLWIFIGGCLLTAVGALFLQLDYPTTYRDQGFVAQVHVTGPIAAAALTGLAVTLAIVLFIVLRLRQLFMTLTAGDPFHPGNIARLQAIGFGLAGLEAANMVGRLVAPLLLLSQAHLSLGSVDLTSWFAVLVVFVLAEVFREGARLRREAELTI